MGFVLFAFAGVAFGYAAPRAWAFLPIAIPLTLGLYTGFRDGFDGELVVLIALGVAVTVVGVIVGRLIVGRTEGRGATAPPSG
ncbi:MAG TPA: hypothetical protein VF520_08240 [Thermoleophilaceae bacterium]|jgi:hypothetical protein